MKDKSYLKCSQRPRISILRPLKQFLDSFIIKKKKTPLNPLILALNQFSPFDSID